MRRDASNPWPELLRPPTAAAMLDVAENTFRAIWPILAAEYGLKIAGLSGPKFLKDNLLSVIGRLADEGLDIVVDKAAGHVRIGSVSHPIRSSRTGKSRRGRPSNGGGAA